MSTRTLRLSTLAFSSLLTLGACSSGGGSDSTSPTRPDPTGTAGTAAPAAPGDAIHRIGPEEFQDFMTENPEVPVVNVHIPYEQHIAGTDAFVAFDTIAGWNDLPEDVDAPIALYCRSGNMSGEAADTLAALGYTNITDLDGGMNAWSAASLPLLDEEPATN